MVWLPDGSLRIWLLVSTQYVNATDSRTDIQTSCVSVVRGMRTHCEVKYPHSGRVLVSMRRLSRKKPASESLPRTRSTLSKSLMVSAGVSKLGKIDLHVCRVYWTWNSSILEWRSVAHRRKLMTLVNWSSVCSMSIAWLGGKRDQLHNKRVIRRFRACTRASDDILSTFVLVSWFCEQ